MNRSSAEGEQGSSSGTSAACNLMVGNRCEEASSDGLVNRQVPFSMKRRSHINNERQRRLHVNNILKSLQELLPDPNPPKDRYTLITNVISYLQSLEDKAQDLSIRKEVHMAHLAQAKKFVKPRKVSTLAIPSHLVFLQNVNVQVFKSVKATTDLEEIIITFTSLRTKGIFSQILMIFNINQIEIINATFSTSPDDQMLHFIHAQVPKYLNLQSDDVKALFSSPSQLVADEGNIT